MDDLLTAIVAEVRGRLDEWYPDRAGDRNVHVDLESDDRRSVSRVVRLRVVRDGVPAEALIVKTGSRDPAGLAGARPRLMPLTQPGLRPGFELEALRLLERRLSEVGDERLRPIRALAVLEGSNALVMEAYAGRPLHRLLLRSTIRRASATTRPLALASAAGAWLRVFHDTEVPESMPIRQGSPSELAAAFAMFGDFLATAAPSRELGRAIDVGQTAAAGVGVLPIALSHGDFAPRNILVDGSGRIAVIDLLARWRAPRYEDLAAFLLAIRTSRVNAATNGLVFGRAIDRLEPAFLDGYFGSEPIPLHEVRLYELLLLLDKWSARLSRRARSADGGLQARLIDRYFVSRSRHLARLLDAGR